MSTLKIFNPESEDWIEIAGSTSSGITVHGDLSGLDSDDHTQYILADGTRDFTGFPETPAAAPTADYEIANKKYVDDQVPSGILSGDPTASIGLTTVSGVASTYMRSDAAPALDQSISPTWSADHEFTANITLADTISSAVGVIMKGATSFIHNFHPLGTACYNLFIGEDAGNFTLTSSAKYLVAIGYRALKAITSGNRVVAIGYKALEGSALPVDCVAIGYRAMAATTATTVQGSVAIGSNALAAVQGGNYNLAIGTDALEAFITGEGNTAIGVDALNNATTCSYNNCVGYGTGLLITTGSQNVSVGTSSLYNVTTADGNVGLGYRAGRYKGADTAALSNPASGIYIGTLSRGLEDGETNAIVIGAQALGSGTNTVVLGNDDITDTYLKGALHIGGGIGITEFSIDGTLAGNSNTALPTEQAIKTYVDSVIPSGVIPSGLITTEHMHSKLVASDGTPDPAISADADGAISIAVSLTLAGGATITQFSTDESLTANSDNLVSTQQAVKQYINTGLSTKAAVTHYHSSLVASDGAPNPAISVDADGSLYFPKGVAIDEFSNDGTLAGDSATALPTEHAVKTYVDSNSGASGPVFLTQDRPTEDFVIPSGYTAFWPNLDTSSATVTVNGTLIV